MTAKDFVIEFGELMKYNGTDENVVIPNNVKVIQVGAFERNETLKSVVIPNSVKEVRSEAFYCCENLTNVTFAEDTRIIGSNVFFGCKSLTNVILPKNLIFLGSYTFSGCNSLANIVIPQNLEFIGIELFADCDNLQSVIFENTSGWNYYTDSPEEYFKAYPNSTEEFYDDEIYPIAIDEEMLKNPKIAAGYLTKHYLSYDWRRGDHL